LTALDKTIKFFISHCGERAGFLFGIFLCKGEIMAGDWIKLEHATIDKPEVFKMAEILEIDPNHVLGSLISVWVWMDKQLKDCNAKNVTKLLLDRCAHITGFADAMLQVGWLVQGDDGLGVPNFDRHLGNSAKKRAESNRRVTQHRQKCNTKSVTKELQKALPEKRREEKSIKEKDKKKPSAIVNPYKKWTADEFWNEIVSVNQEKNYDQKMVEKFYIYWAEMNDKGKMRFQMEKTWSTVGRLANWHSRQN
jgi:hypothetical protein